jgi:hypothetical protein
LDLIGKASLGSAAGIVGGIALQVTANYNLTLNERALVTSATAAISVTLFMVAGVQAQTMPGLGLIFAAAALVAAAAIVAGSYYPGFAALVIMMAAIPAGYITDRRRHQPQLSPIGRR